MNKQTVSEKYEQRQLIKQQAVEVFPPEQHVVPHSNPVQSLQKTFTEVEKAIQQSLQSVRQAQAKQPTHTKLKDAEQRLQHAVLQLQQLKSAQPEPAKGLPKSIQQQLTQLEHQLNEAGQTLQLINMSTSSGN